MAVFAPWLGVLVVGDYLSPVEIPMISPGGSLAELPRHAGRAGAGGRAGRRAWCPATARRMDRETALRVIEEDLSYLDALERGQERPPLPEGRDSPSSGASTPRTGPPCDAARHEGGWR